MLPRGAARFAMTDPLDAGGERLGPAHRAVAEVFQNVNLDSGETSLPFDSELPIDFVVEVGEGVEEACAGPSHVAVWVLDNDHSAAVIDLNVGQDVPHGGRSFVNRPRAPDAAAAGPELTPRARPSSRTGASGPNLPTSLLEVRLLAVSEAVLALGIASGMARDYLSSGRLLHFDHKTLLAGLAFLVIGTLLVLHKRNGLRGQRAARLVLVAYLLLTLAYPGVEFITDVVIG